VHCVRVLLLCNQMLNVVYGNNHFFESNTKRIISLYRRNVECLNIQPGGRYSILSVKGQCLRF